MTTEPNILATDADGRPDPAEFADALDLAADQHRPTWVADPDGRRIAALVPVEVLEFHQAAIGAPLTGRHHAASQS